MESMDTTHTFNNLAVGEDDLITPLTEGDYTRSSPRSSPKSSFYLKAKNNLRESKKWAYVHLWLGIVSICLGLSSILFRYVVMHWEFEQAQPYKWVLGFVFGGCVIVVGIMQLMTYCLLKFPTLRLLMTVLLAFCLAGSAIYGMVISGFGVLMWGNTYPRHGAFAIIEIIISILLQLVIWMMSIVIAGVQLYYVAIEMKYYK
jgi:hypothetical protein